MTYLLIVVLGGILSAQFVLGRLVSEPLRSILRIQAVYWLLGYVVRPAILVIASPAPVQNDSVADYRLAYGGYAGNLDEVLWPVVVGQSLFLVTVLVLGKRFCSRFRAVEVSPALVLILAVILLAARLGWLLGARSPIVVTLLELAPIVVAMILVPAHPPRRLVLLVSLLLVSEGAWSVLFASKTPIFSLLFCVLIVMVLRGWRPKLKHAAWAAAALPAFVLGFALLQAVKQSAAVEADLEVVNRRYPAAVRPLLPIARRFDLFEAVTDSMYVRGRWISFEEFAHRAVLSFVPRPLTEAKARLSGERWATDVRNASKPTRPGVSLAEGPVAEGNALAGLPGVVIECVALAGITVAGARALAVGGVFAFCFGASLVFLPTIQERGLLGVTEVTGKTLQLAVVVVVLSFAFGGLRRRSGGPPALGGLPPAAVLVASHRSGRSSETTIRSPRTDVEDDTEGQDHRSRVDPPDTDPSQRRARTRVKPVPITTLQPAFRSLGPGTVRDSRTPSGDS